jgi:hypothetical protein
MAEDFTTYAEVDPNSHLSVSSSRVTVSGLIRNETAYVAKDKGASYFSGDFTHKVDVNCSSVSGAFAQNSVWSLSEGLGSLQDMIDGSYDSLFLGFIFASSKIQVTIYEFYGGSLYQDQYIGAAPPVTYYLTIQRTGTALTVKIYSDAARTTLLDTLSLELHAAVAYQYVYATQSRDEAGTEAWSGYVENLVFVVFHTVTISETLGLSDDLSRKASFKQALTEKLGLTDALTKKASFYQAISDSLGLTDSVLAEKIAKVSDLFRRLVKRIESYG